LSMVRANADFDAEFVAAGAAVVVLAHPVRATAERAAMASMECL
jgi:hypothetical protein